MSVITFAREKTASDCGSMLINILWSAREFSYYWTRAGFRRRTVLNSGSRGFLPLEEDTDDPLSDDFVRRRCQNHSWFAHVEDNYWIIRCWSIETQLPHGRICLQRVSHQWWNSGSCRKSQTSHHVSALPIWTRCYQSSHAMPPLEVLVCIELIIESLILPWLGVLDWCLDLHY